MSTVKRKCQVVMLPTEKASDLFVGKTHGVLHYKNTIPDEDCKLYQHLYILSDDEIKIGDWVIMLDSFGNVFSNPQQYTDPKTQHLNKGLRKIIATTDSSLGLPQPSKSFILKYIEAYNNGKPIEKVMVEYEYIKGIGEEFGYDSSDINSLKINPKDNTITISKVKDSWTREEVGNLLNQMRLDLDKTGVISNEEFIKWVEENL